MAGSFILPQFGHAATGWFFNNGRPMGRDYFKYSPNFLFYYRDKRLTGHDFGSKGLETVE